MQTRSNLVAGCGATLLLIMFAAACSGGGSRYAGKRRTGSVPAPAVIGSPAPSAVAGAAGPVTGHVGDTLSFAELGGDKVEATLIMVIDPATEADTNNAVPDGNRWVGLVVTIVNNSTDIAGHSASFDGLDSDGKRIDQTATAYAIGSFTECTPTSGDP